MQQWALLLSAYSYEIRFRPTKIHANADSLSRLPLPVTEPVGNPPDPAIFNLAQLEALPVQAQDVAKATRLDPELRLLLNCLREGWPQMTPPSLIPFFRRMEEMCVEGDCIL